MKIVFIGGRDIRILGGIENYMYNLATQLVRAGHEAVVYCESDHSGVETVNGFKVISMKGPKSNLLCKPWVSLKATLRTLFREKGVSLIHYNAWPPALWSWIPRLFGIPTVMEGHGHEWQRSKYSPRQQRILKRMERRSARTNRHLILCSESQRRYYKEHYGRDAVTVPTAVNLPAAETPSSDILQKFDLTPGRFFLSMGRLVPDKNPDYLIQGFLAAGLSGWKLVIAGANDAMPDYVAKLHALGEGHPEVVFTGAVYGADKDCLLRNSALFCLPSTIEGLSIVLLEAMSYRLPILASDIEANREVLQPDTALWVRPEQAGDIAEALQKAVATEDFSQAVESNYALVRDHYTWERVTARYLQYVETFARKR